jgi:hypothetical protein
MLPPSDMAPPDLWQTVSRLSRPSGRTPDFARLKVANYIPLRNYLAMLDEGRRWNREHF